MTLFAPDLYRNFAIGFLGAGLVIFAGSLDGPALSSKAQAYEVKPTVADEVAVSDEFLIAPDADGAEL